MTRDPKKLRDTILGVLEDHGGTLILRCEREQIADALVAKLCPPKDRKLHKPNRANTRTLCGHGLSSEDAQKRGYTLHLCLPGQHPTCTTCALADLELRNAWRRP